MNESAWFRTPLEVWEVIFRMALNSPLLPTPNDDLFDSTKIFMPQCDSYATYLSMVRFTTNLRRVCRSWDLSIRSFKSWELVVLNLYRFETGSRPKHVLYRPSAEVFPSCTERLEIHSFHCGTFASGTNSECKFGRLCRYSLRLAPVVFTMENSNGPPTITYQPGNCFSTVQVLLIRNYISRDSLHAFLDFTKSLKALEISFSIFEPSMNSTVHHYALKRVTHLKLSTSQKDIYTLKRQAWFPYMRYLHLTISEFSVNVQSSHGNNISNWGSFPQLCSLHLCCTIPEELVSDIYGFIEHCGSNLSDLVLQVNVKPAWGPTARPLRILPQLYICAPKLSRFGSGIGTFLQSPLLPPSTFLPINIILPPITSPAEIDGTKIDSFIASFVKVCRRWHTREVRFLQSWKDLELSTTGNATFRGSYDLDGMIVVGMPWIHKACNPYAYFRFYDAILKYGIMIRDCDGIPITKASGRDFLTARKRSAIQQIIDGRRTPPWL
ncbi:hypothetical protein M408DRAFT_317361 [Serendipita vermifera MAFF 305830]|uniref:Uncharacterized protein n=1 Tax=Serendipita vermifera MAFF 305830 TaxID=933852 RepID=A0A0C2X5P2_SERVB|nr:hypothetical protein M408DRAFT_317361 [Serendipita vermifera MAFF 305830]